MPINVFIASDPTDRSLLDELRAQLGNLIRQGTITVWCEDTMLAGSDQEQERMAQLNQAQLIVLLISADFINSELYPRLLQRALARNRTDRTPVIPILLRSTDIVGAPFAGLVLLPRDGRAVTQWSSHDEAFADILKDLRQTIATLQPGAPAQTSTSASPQAPLWTAYTGRFIWKVN